MSEQLTVTSPAEKTSDQHSRYEAQGIKNLIGSNISISPSEGAIWIEDDVSVSGMNDSRFHSLWLSDLTLYLRAMIFKYIHAEARNESVVTEECSFLLAATEKPRSYQTTLSPSCHPCFFKPLRTSRRRTCIALSKPFRTIWGLVFRSGSLYLSRLGVSKTITLYVAADYPSLLISISGEVRIRHYNYVNLSPQWYQTLVSKLDRDKLVEPKDLEAQQWGLFHVVVPDW